MSSSFSDRVLRKKQEQEAARREAEAAEERAEQQSAQREQRISTWIKVGAVAAILALFAGCQALLSGESTSTGPEAENYCQDFVRDELRAPTTAEFYDERSSGAHPTWTVRGSVDSQNGLGGTVRNDYTCVVTSETERWTLDSLTGLNR